MLAQEVCRRAAELLDGDRARHYGDPRDLHGKIGALWSAYLGHAITAHDVALMMVLLKVGRAKAGRFNLDNYVDGAGYAGIAGGLAVDDN